jgi:hypothetical protein
MPYNGLYCLSGCTKPIVYTLSAGIRFCKRRYLYCLVQNPLIIKLLHKPVLCFLQ